MMILFKKMTHILMIKLLILIGLVTMVNAQESRLIEFEMEDQHGNVHKSSDLENKVVIILGSDREGGDYNKLWAEPIADSLRSINGFDHVSILGVADLDAVPFFMKFMVKGFFPDDPSNQIMMDWDGEFAETYSFEAGHSNLVVFDTEKNKVYQKAVKDFDQDTFDEVWTAIKKLL